MKFAILKNATDESPVRIFEAHTSQQFRHKWNEQPMPSAFVAVFCDRTNEWLLAHAYGRPGKLGAVFLRGICQSDSDAAFVWRCAMSVVDCHSEHADFVSGMGEVIQDGIAGLTNNITIASGESFGRIPVVEHDE